MKKIIISSKYRLNWYKIVLFSVAMVLTGTYSITVNGKTVVSLTLEASSITTSLSMEDQEVVFSFDTTSISLGYSAGSSDTVNITSNTNWHALITYYNDHSGWLDISPNSGSTSGTIILTTNSTNTGSFDRTATVTISSTDFADKIITIKQLYQPHNLGNMNVYSLTETTANRKAMPINFYESGEIQSISIYHNGGTGNVILGIYNDRVSSLIGVTSLTPINTRAGWQTVLLPNPVKVTSGQTVWLSWVFENYTGVRYTIWEPGTAQSSQTWSAGMPITFGPDPDMYFEDKIYSVYCSYIPTPDINVSPTSIPLGYSSQSEGTFSITSNTTWTITDYPDWLDVSPRSGSNNGIITLKAISSNTGTSRKGTVTIAGNGVEDNTISITQEYQPNTLGNTNVNSSALSSDQSAYRKAQPVIVYESGEIESISVYHNGGAGNVLLGVYSDQAGSPASLLGVTTPTPINSEAGWQTVSLINHVIVTSGQRVWLSWVFDYNPGIRYTKELHSVAESAESWLAGMPITFGITALADLKYSVYCTYKPDKAIPTLTISQSKISLDNYTYASATFTVTSNSSWNIVVDSNWTNGLKVSPVSGTNNATITLTNSQYLGRSRTTTVYIYCTGTELFRVLEVTSPSYLQDLGNIDLYSGQVPTTISKTEYRKAQPVTFIESGKIESITLYHNGGIGNVILGVYSDHAGSPSLLLGKTALTAAGIYDQWQEVSLINPVPVFRGQTVWLSWVFEDNPGVKYIEGFPSGVESTETWSSGIPSTFGTANSTNFEYAIYCSFSPDAAFPYLTVSEPYISLGADSWSSESIFIESNTGWIITSNASWLNVSLENGSGNRTITFTANSPNTGTTSRTATVSISCPGFTNKTITVTQNNQTNATNNPGYITYQVWNNIGKGLTVGSLTSNTNYPNNPTSSKLITSMEGTTNLGDSYGARIVGYIHAPATGSYTFWIASDDYGELWLSTNDDQANKHKIAYVNGYTWIRTWNKYATQKSATINLIQGQKYYIEALMKEATGHDNLAVGWLKPGESGTVPSEIIPGSVLSPYGIILLSSVTLPPALNLNTGASVWLPATALPANATVKTLNWTTSDPTVALVNSYGIVTGISTGNATISATSTDGSNKSGTCVVTVAGVPTVCSATGNITYQVWNNIGNGLTVSSLTSNINYPNNPTSTKLITSMEGTTDLGDNYGARIAGYICAPATGSYTFWIASDDYGELWLSTNDDPANKYKIAYVNGYTWIRTWNKYATQKSVTINLVQGQKYYIEALMKEATGYDNLAVGWLKPGESGTIPSQVIPGSVLSPFTEPVKNSEPNTENQALSETNVKLSVYPNPLMNGELNIKLENLESDATLRIFTISGVKCYEKIIQNSEIIQVDRSVFTSGIYIIKLQNENFVKTTKLIVD